MQIAQKSVSKSIQNECASDTADEEGYFALIRAAFGQRRKTAAELNAAEGCVEDQQEDALVTGELLGLQCGQGQKGHDEEHQGHIQHQRGIDSEQGAGLGDAEGGQGHGSAGHQHQIEDVRTDDVAQGQGYQDQRAACLEEGTGPQAECTVKFDIL